MLNRKLNQKMFLFEQTKSHEPDRKCLEPSTGIVRVGEAFRRQARKEDKHHIVCYRYRDGLIFV